MNNFYRFFRYAMFLAVGMVCMMPAMAQHPFTLTTASDIANSTQHYYLMQSVDRTTFYALPESGAADSKVSTTSIPNANMRWYFMDAGIESDIQYYYIVNSTDRCLYRKNDNTNGIRINKTYAEVSALNPETQLAELNTYKFYLEQTGSDYYIHPKGATLYVNKKGGNVPYGGDYYFKTSEAYDDPSKWRFVAVGSVTWPQPFTVYTDVDKHYYKFQNVTSTSYYLSNSGEWATVSNLGSDADIWYFLDAGTDATYSNCHYFFIVNAVTNKYLYYIEGTENNVSQVKDYDPEEGDNYRFLIVDAAYKPNNNYATAYSIVPKLRQAYFYDKDSFAPIAMSNDSRLLLKNDRNSINYDSHWTFVATEYVGVTVVAPTITNNYNGTISLSTTTPGATIYYTLDGTTPDNTSTAYSSAFDLGDATVIKAIAYLDSDYSDVSTYNVPTYTTPTISYDDVTSEVTIISDGTIYYNTGDGSQADPTPSSGTLYSEPFTIDSDITVKAIATHAGFLNSDVTTWSVPQIPDYSQEYLTFDVITNGTILWKQVGSVSKTISYSTDNGTTWTEITASTAGSVINVTAGDKVLLKGTNESYAVDKSNYSGFDGGTATYNIQGNIMSLVYGDRFSGQTTLTGTFNFCSIFKQSKAVSAENLILPATTLTNYCYRAMFSKAPNMAVAPVLPATTLAKGCYWYMFEECPITTAPDLNATTLFAECYGHMFCNCSALNNIKCLATTGFNTSNCLAGWTEGVAATGTFVKDADADWDSGTSGIPSGWTTKEVPNIPTISCSGRDIELTCGTTGAVIYYQLDHSGSYTPYSTETAIPILVDTFIECYSEKDGQRSSTVSQTCEYDDRTIYEYSNQSIDTWTYGGNTITTPYSVNAIDGHSSSYAKGTFNFETDVNLRSAQPTYLWFQHADQSAEIYIDDVLVTKHWGGYNAFFVDLSSNVHKGTNHIKVALKNNEGNYLAPAAGDFNFNATLGNVKLFTSPYLPSMNYGYDGFHITSTVSSAEATINVKTTIPTGASVVCTISGDNCNYTETKSSTGNELVFTTTITDPHLWNGTIDPYLYNVKLEIYDGDELYHSYERPYGLRFFEYVVDNETPANSRFMLNGSPYLLRGVCVHDDLADKANALNDDDYTQEFNIITELGCNFLRLAHYPHPKEVYDKCDQLGIVVQTEVPCVNKLQSTMPDDYYTHLEGQYRDMVNQHYNHPCILFWGLSNEAVTDNSSFAKTTVEGYTSLIKSLDSERLVGYVVSHSIDNPSNYFGNPNNVDWFGCNIYVGWYIDQNSNNPTGRLNTRLNNTLTSLNKPLAYSEYGCGGTQSCHSDDFMSTTTRGNNPRHDIEYQMWLHEGHIAAIKEKPQLLFTSQWQLFDIAVSNRVEGYKVSLDGETVFDDNELKRLNNKGLVERDHITKKDTYYLYKAWWNQTDKFVHICGKDYEKSTGRVIKCYTNDGTSLSLYVNNILIETVSVTNNIATFTSRNFSGGDVIRVEGASTNDTFTFTNDRSAVFATNGAWNLVSNWSDNKVPTVGSDIEIAANATIPADYVAHVGDISINSGATLTIADGGQLYHTNTGVTATVQKETKAATAKDATYWYAISSAVANPSISSATNIATGTYDFYRYNEEKNAGLPWENYKNTAYSETFTTLEQGRGYLYRNAADLSIAMTGVINVAAIDYPVTKTGTGVLAGFNLIGNPYSHDIYKGAGTAIPNGTDFLRTGFYYMNPEDGSWTPGTDGTTVIKPNEAILVQTDANGNIAMTNTNSTGTSKYNNDNIMFKVANSQYSDETYAWFDKGRGLNKINHRNSEVPMLYINQDGEDYAIATMSDDTKSFSLNFKAMTMGRYTLSYKTKGEFKYLHVLDRLTGEDVDMLLEGEYSFVASPSDNNARFIVKLAYMPDYSDAENDIFAYQNGSEILVSGDGELQIFDVMGRLVMNERINGVERISGLENGVYIFRLEGKTQKIVIR